MTTGNVLDPRIKSIVSNAGMTFDLLPRGVTCVVGANNVGKSQLLRDLGFVLRDASKGVVVASLSVEKQPVDADDVEAWLNTHALEVRQPNRQPNFQPLTGDRVQVERRVFTELFNNPNAMGITASFFLWFADAQGRIGLGSGSIGSTPGMDRNPHPLAHLYRDGDLEAQLSDLSQEVFGLPLTLDRINGNTMLRVGKPSSPPPPIDHPTVDYANEVERLPPLETQGDGVKSFVGLALYLMTAAQRMVLIDEPEAFLHQSQAKALGRWLGKQSVEKDRQVILATHDRNIVLGLLAADTPVTILRLTRSGDTSDIHQLHATDLREVWADPVLRYSNVLDGLFYSKVIVCEGDADCRFYSAVLEGLVEDGAVTVNPDDVLFVPSGGKSGTARIASSLSALDVTTFAVCDFDVLKDRSELKKIVISVQGSWSQTMDQDYNTFASALNANGGSGWAACKVQGVSAVPPGSAYTAALAFLNSLDAQRVLVVRVGEMEGFNRSSNKKSTPWVTEMLENGGHKTSNEARTMMKLIG